MRLSRKTTVLMPEKTISETLSNAVIAALANDQERSTVCLAYAEGSLAVPRPTVRETDEVTGSAIRARYGREIAGELAGYADWVIVGRYFREELEDK